MSITELSKLQTMYEVILYYHFHEIVSPEEFCKAHRAKCKELGLTGYSRLKEDYETLQYCKRPYSRDCK